MLQVAGRRRHRPRRPPRGRPSARARLVYQRHLLAIIAQIAEQIRSIDLTALMRQAEREGLRTRRDAAPLPTQAPWGGSFTQGLASIFRGFSVYSASVSQEALERVARIEDATSSDLFRRQLKALIGLEVIIPSPTTVIGNFVQENLDKIESLTGDILSKARRVISDEAQAGTRIEQIQKMLERDLGIARKKASLLANDQVLRLHGRLSESRQTSAGIEEYDWWSSDDERVRPRHRQLHRTRQRWSDPPVVDIKSGRRAHPGQDYRCRCQPIPVIPDISPPPEEAQEMKPFDLRPPVSKVHELARRRGIKEYKLERFEDIGGEGRYRTVETAVVVQGEIIAVVRKTRRGRVRWIGFGASDPSIGIGG
jgi:SPP1 gp7 family putative phage head morphogenesis protein